MPPGDPEVENGIVKFVMRRKFDTGDAKDFVVPEDEEFVIGWALNELYSDETFRHSRAGSVRVTIPAAAPPQPDMEDNVINTGPSVNTPPEDSATHTTSLAFAAVLGAASLLAF